MSQWEQKIGNETSERAESGYETILMYTACELMLCSQTNQFHKTMCHVSGHDFLGKYCFCMENYRFLAFLCLCP